MKTLKFYLLLALLAIVSACEDDHYVFPIENPVNPMTSEKLSGSFDVKFTERTQFSENLEFEVDMHGNGQLNNSSTRIEMNHIQFNIKNSELDTVSHGILCLVDEQTGSELIGEYGGLTETTKNGAVRHVTADIVRGSKAFSNTTGEIWVTLSDKNDSKFTAEINGYVHKKKQAK